jgi:hypothetical protein
MAQRVLLAQQEHQQIQVQQVHKALLEQLVLLELQVQQDQ